MIPKIYGFNKTSEAGMNVFAPSIFVQGCNFQCPFCFNAKLAKSQMKPKDEIDIEVVKKHVIDNKCDMIMISGGEALMHKDLIELTNVFKELGCKIGLSTHGLFYSRLSQLLPELSYVALDIKTFDSKVYDGLVLGETHQTRRKVFIAKSILRQQAEKRDDFTYEVRTTLYPPYINRDSIFGIGRAMRESEVWILQQYRPTNNLYDMKSTKGIEPYGDDELQELLKIAKIFTPNVHLRYV